MGKRAAAKPKSAGPAPAAKRARANAAGAAAVVPASPPPPAPAYWARPAPKAAGTGEALRFFLVDLEDGPAGPDAAGPAHELRLYGVTAEGCSVCARLTGVRPYFYARCSVDVCGREDALRVALDAAVAAAVKGAQGLVHSVEVVRKTPVLMYQPEVDLVKVIVAGPRVMGPCQKAFEQGIKLAPGAGSESAVEVQCLASFEANIPLVLRFLVDSDLGGGRWVQLPAGAYREVLTDKLSCTQIEVEADAASVLAVPLDSEVGSGVPPVRTLGIEVLTDAEGRLGAAACALSVQGERRLQARAVWVRLETSGPPAGDAEGDDWGEVKVEEYNPGKEEDAKVFTCTDEALLIEHLGQTLELLDADILLTHDLLRTGRGLLGPKGVARANSALVRGLCRRVGTEVKLTPKSGEIAGLSGRLGFDLQKQVQKEHNLLNYTLGGLLEHFCQLPLPELREATLSSLRVQRPRAYAQHVLRQAEANIHIFDKKAYLFNFVEMARVTSCPLSYLLERGQAVKVQAQILREAGRRGFVLPSQRPSTGEETTFEGATVLEPLCGFYRSPVSVLDFASLYPSIMMAHNLCYTTLLPTSLAQRLEAPAHVVAPAPAADEGLGVSRTCFVEASVRKGLLPSILEQLIGARKVAKKQLALCGPNEETRKKVLNGRQLALKLSANSVYGITGATNGPLPCLELAGAITAYGREMLRFTKSKVEEHFCRARGYEHDAEVLYGDTDSVMVRFGPEGLSLEEAIRLSREAAEVCSAAFPPPVRLEFEKVYRPFLIMNKKRYAGLAWTSVDCTPSMETKGIETVRRDWSDLVRQGLERTLQLLLRPDGGDGSSEAIAYVRSLCDDLRQNKVDFRSLVISKSLGRDEYAAKAPHAEVAEKLKKRDPATAPSIGDRVSFLVLAGAAKSKVYERAEDPLYALENELPVDAEYYLEHQLKQPLVRVFEHVCGGDAQKAEQVLFGAGAGQKVVVAAAASASASRGLGKFMKARPKCLACGQASAAADAAAFCEACAAKGPEREREVREALLAKARGLRAQLEELRAQCRARCAAPSGNFVELPTDAGDIAAPTAQVAGGAAARESCANVNCQVIFQRARFAKELASASEGLTRLGMAEW